MNNNMPMKTKLFFLSALLLAMQGVCGCGGDDDDKTTFQSRWSGCKNESYDTRSGNQLPWDEECVEYEAKDGGRLYLKHVNALFNCATENVEVITSVNGNHINIVEHAIGNMSANCICPSDVECLLSGLSKGKYSISIFRERISGADLQFSFSIDYEESLKGILKR